MQWFYCLPAVAQALIMAAVAYLASAAGAATVLFLKGLGARLQASLTGLSAGIMISACVFSLLVPAAEAVGSSAFALAGTASAFALGGGAVVAGDVLLRLLKVPASRRSIFLLYGGITLHNVPEGLSMGLAFAVGGSAFSAAVYSLGIAVQNIPEGACLAYALKSRGLTRGLSFRLAGISSLAEVASAVGAALLAPLAGGGMPYVLSFCAGAMLAVVCGELIPEAFSTYKTLSTIGFIIGFALMTLLEAAF